MRLTISQRLDAFILLCGGYAFVGAALTLIGWWAGIPALFDWDGDGITMKPNSALCVLLVSIALILFLLQPTSVKLIRVFALAPVLIGVLTLFEHLTSVNLGIDLFLFPMLNGMWATTAPARMGLPMSISTIFLGIGFLALTHASHRHLRLTALLCGLIPLGLSLLAITGEMFDADPLFAITRLTTISEQAATMVFALGMGLMLIPRWGLRGILEEPSPTGTLVRWALPLALLGPILLGFLKKSAEVMGLLDDDFGTALRTVIEIGLLSYLIWWGTNKLLGNELALRHRERELSDFFENATVAIHWISADGTILKANKAALDLLGYSSDELIGRNIAEFHVERPAIESLMSQLMNGNAVEQAAAQVRRKDGTFRDVQISAGAYFESGHFVHARCFIVDVTEAKLAERDRGRLAAIVEDSDDAIISKTLDGVISSWNLAAERLYGYTAAEAMGRSIDLIIPPNLRGEQRSILEQIRRGNRIDHFETIRLHKDGHRVHVSLTVSPMRNRAGGIIGVSKVARDITDRKLAESRIMAEKERVQILADAVPALISYINPEFEYVLVNEAYEKWFSKPRIAIIGQRMRDILGEASWEIVRPHAEKAISGQVTRFEAEMHYPHQPPRWIDVTYTPDIDIDGRVRGFVAHVNDITQRKRAEEQIEHSLERQRILSEALGYLLSHQDLDVAIRGLFDKVAAHLHIDTYFNFMAEEHEKVLTLHSFAGVPAEVARGIGRVEFGQAICGTVALIRKPIVASDIQHSTFDKADLVRELGMQVYACFPLFHAARLLGTLSFASRSRTHFSDEELQFLQTIAHYAAVAIAQMRFSQELQRSKDSLSFLVERAPFGVYVVDSQFRIAMINAGSQARAFRNVNPAVGRDFAEAIGILWPAPVAAEIVRVFRHTLATGEPYIFKDYTQPRADIDEVESYEWEVHRILLPDGQYGVVCYYYESTMLRRAEQALRDSDRKKDEFLAILAHELRNPLAILRNVLEILRRGPQSDRSHRESFDTMDRQLRQMVRQIDDLLDISRISKGKIELRKERCELSQIIRQAAENALPLVRCETHEVTIQLPDEPILLHGDPVRLTQVFANLLNNACKYTEPGGFIHLTARREGDEAVVSVRDTGVGILPSQLDEIFELFAQAHQSYERAHGGLGIGLTLARRLVELHGGTIQAHSEGPGRGSEFTVRLPTLKPATAAPDPKSNGGVSHVTPRRILVVDDNEDSARSMAMIMKLDGHETHVAFDGISALDSARTLQPDVALLDIGLPQLNGYDVCRRLRSEPWGREMVLIALTGWGQESDRRKSQEAGFNAHLVKPVDPDDLSRMLEQLCAGNAAD